MPEIDNFSDKNFRHNLQFDKLIGLAAQPHFLGVDNLMNAAPRLYALNQVFAFIGGPGVNQIRLAFSKATGSRLARMPMSVIVDLGARALQSQSTDILFSMLM